MSCQEEKLYILGHPVAHSKSPAMYNALYSQLGLSWRYDFMDMADEDDARAFLTSRDFLSINITTPYKPHAYEAATVRDASAILAKGANLLVRAGDDLVGYNTDGRGCVAYLQREGVAFANARVVVCGTGPTSMAILHACGAANADCVTLVGRDGARARRTLDAYLTELKRLTGGSSASETEASSAQAALASAAVTVLGTSFAAGSYDELAEAISYADVVIDATSLGMKAGDPSPFDTGLLREGQTAFDVVYGHGETAFAVGARAAGARVFTGGGMLVGQAVVTAQLVLEAAGVEHDFSFDDFFGIMAQAGGFAV